MSDSVDFSLSYPPYNDRSGREDANSRYDIFNLESMSDVVALCKLVMKTGAHSDLFFLRNSSLSATTCSQEQRGREDSDSDGGECIAIENDEGKKKAVSGAGGVLLHHCQEVRKMMTCNFSHNAHHIDICE